MARVIFVNRFYWPDETATGQLLTDLAEALAELGHDVSVITSGAKPRERGEDRRRGVRIIRLHSTRLDRGGWAKASDWISFLFASFWSMLRQTRRGDVLVAMTDPPLLGVAAWLATRGRGVRLVQWVQDIYPEIAIQLARQRWLGVLRTLRSIAWRAADRCVTLGSDMAATLGRERVLTSRIALVPNWAPAGLGPQRNGDDFRTAWGLTGKFVVAYSGNLGRVHDLTVVARLAEALRNDANIALVIVGDGAQRGLLAKEIEQRRLTNVTFQPAQPRAQLGRALATGDVHLVTLRAGCEPLVFPSKFYGIAAAGRPVVFLGPADCELARLIREHRLGLAVSPEKVEDAATFIRGLAAAADQHAGYREAALSFAASRGLAEAARAWDNLLNTLSTPGPTA